MDRSRDGSEFPRLKRRGWIETETQALEGPDQQGFPRLKRRGWIETYASAVPCHVTVVPSPEKAGVD